MISNLEGKDAAGSGAQSAKTSHGCPASISGADKPAAPGEREGGRAQSVKTSHGGTAPTSGIRKRRGAKPGNQQALKHGRYTKKTMAIFKEIAECARLTRAALAVGEAELARREGRAPRKRVRTR